MRRAFLETAEVVSTLLHYPELAARWEQPSALPSFRVSGLAGHLARLSVARHGFLPVLRTLSRRERADGSVAAF